jgi:hypothetical protein
VPVHATLMINVQRFVSDIRTEGHARTLQLGDLPLSRYDLSIDNARRFSESLPQFIGIGNGQRRPDLYLAGSDVASSQNTEAATNGTSPSLMS